MARNNTARKPAPEATLSRRILVVISRDALTKTPRVIWQHEFPILEAIFGEGNVAELEDVSKALDEGFSARVSPALLIHNKVTDPPKPPSQTVGIGYVFHGDARTEYDRLEGTYGRRPDVNQSWIESVFGRFQDGRFSDLIGAPALDDLPDQQLRELIVEYGYMPVLSEKAGDAEKDAYTARYKGLRAMEHAELVKTATEQGVEVG